MHSKLVIVTRSQIVSSSTYLYGFLMETLLEALNVREYSIYVATGKRQLYFETSLNAIRTSQLVVITDRLTEI